jgi:hypothetical protein
MGERFYSEEEFLKWIKKFAPEPHYWIDLFHEDIIEIHGMNRKYYVKRQVVDSMVDELKNKIKGLSKEEILPTIKKFIKNKTKGIFSEDEGVIAHYFLGAVSVYIKEAYQLVKHFFRISINNLHLILVRFYENQK